MTRTTRREAAAWGSVKPGPRRGRITRLLSRPRFVDLRPGDTFRAAPAARLLRVVDVAHSPSTVAVTARVVSAGRFLPPVQMFRSPTDRVYSHTPTTEEPTP